MSSYLEERIEWYDHNYRMGKPLINDDQFDKLEANLFRVNPKATYFSKKSILPLPSLPKDSIKEFLVGLLPDTRLIIEPKIDGCAIALQYIDGVLIKAISRKGGDLTNKIKKIPDVPDKIKVQGLIQIRGDFLTLQNMHDQVIPNDRLLLLCVLLIAKVIILAFVFSR